MFLGFSDIYRFSLDWGRLKDFNNFLTSRTVQRPKNRTKKKRGKK